MEFSSPEFYLILVRIGSELEEDNLVDLPGPLMELQKEILQVFAKYSFKTKTIGTPGCSRATKWVFKEKPREKT